MSRLSPIPDSRTTLKGYPSTLLLYKIESSKYYWVRFFYNGKYLTKTTKTQSLKDAKIFAIDFYKSTLISAITSQTSSPLKSFASIGNQFFETTQRNTTKSVFSSDFNRYKQHILPEFKQQDIDTITNAQITAFVEKLHKTKIKPATIKHHIIVLRKIMRFAIANDLMKNLPVFPRIIGKLRTSEKRDYLTNEEYDKVIACAEKLANQGVVERGIPITIEMKYLIQLMVNSFIRPSDIRVLKHKHIKKLEDGKTSWLELSHPATKTTSNAVQAMPVSVHIYERLMEYRKSVKLKATIEDFVYFPQYKNRNTAIQVFARLFKRIIKETEIQTSSDKKITLYSLRHTAIMMRLIMGNVNTLALARNARTSQAMIDKFYASHLTTPQVREQLHAFIEKDVKKSTPTKKTPRKTTFKTEKHT